MKALIFSFLTVTSLVSANLEPLPRFDWTSLMAAQDKLSGGQILHFNSSDKPFQLNADAVAFQTAYLSQAVACESDAEVLKFASDSIQIEGTIIEVGTKAGKNANFLAALNPKQTIYSFDSTHGLPSDWVREDQIIPAGTFAYNSPTAVPPVLRNVQLFRGDYSTMLAQLDNTPVALLHVDCEIYESTHQVLEALSEKIVPGTVIVFDEAYNYPGSENHEWKAFLEFCAAKDVTFQPIAYNTMHEQVAVIIQEKS